MARQQGFARAGFPGDEYRAASHDEADAGSVVTMAEHQPPAAHLRGRQPRLFQELPDVRRDGRWTVALDDLIGYRAQRRTAPAYRDAHFARVEQIVVVFRVADADRVV